MCIAFSKVCFPDRIFNLRGAFIDCSNLNGLSLPWVYEFDFLIRQSCWHYQCYLPLALLVLPSFGSVASVNTAFVPEVNLEQDIGVKLCEMEIEDNFPVSVD